MTQASFATHEVFNQSPPFEDVDLFALDRPLKEAVAANGGARRAKGTFRIRPALGLGRDGRARTALPTRTHRNCGHSMRAASGATGSSFIPPITS